MPRSVEYKTSEGLVQVISCLLPKPHSSLPFATIPAMSSPGMPVELIVAIIISSTALVGLVIISIFICSQQASRNRQAYRSQRASSLRRASENAQRYASATQGHSDSSSPPHSFQQSQYWPLSNARPPPRTQQSEHVDNTGWLEQQIVPNGQQDCGRFESNQRDERWAPRITSPAESHYLGRRVELPTVPSWQQQDRELHFGH